MSNQFFSGLSQNYLEILNDDEYYDITIEVGEDPSEDPNSKILKILVTTDQQELIDYIQKYLIENKSEWVVQYFELI
ncbi:hypothetical protein RhiirA4_484865 [Rhizophagus irregularis]|uniref:Uncharacterized protein n=1 Tax=Rhizophagus irregularis TaxID=588596 RepID=A0A2I1HPJ2_9GLOM|nr:hypothetical protein RhiirA4_484865 [Rhizophagus irregularis]